MSLLTTWRLASLRKRFWLAGGGVALFLLTLVAAGPLFDPSPDDGKLDLGYDFLPAYVAGHFARTGEYQKMYDRVAFSEMQTRVIREAGLDMDGRYGAGLNPPHFALMFAPLSALPYRTAAAAWCGLNVLFAAGSIFLLARMLPASFSLRGLVPLLVVVSMPFCQAVGHQQNTLLSLLLLTTAVTFWRAGYSFAAGAAAGLLFYKPQLAAVVALVIVVDLGRRAALGLGVIGLLTLLVTVACMPGALAEYLQTLPLNVDWIQNKLHYNWGRQTTFLGFWRLLIQGRQPGSVLPAVRLLYGASAAAIAVAFAMEWWRARRAVRHGSDAGTARDRLIAASVACGPLLIPYFMDYDLLLLSAAAVLFASGLIGRDPREWTRGDRWTCRAWVALYVWAYVNPGLSGTLGVSLNVPLLAVVAAGLAVRCGRSDAVDQTPLKFEPAVQPRPLAA